MATNYSSVLKEELQLRDDIKLVERSLSCKLANTKLSGRLKPEILSPYALSALPCIRSENIF